MTPSLTAEVSDLTSSALWLYDSRIRMQLWTSNGNCLRSRLHGDFTDSLWLIHNVPFWNDGIKTVVYFPFVVWKDTQGSTRRSRVTNWVRWKCGRKPSILFYFVFVHAQDVLLSPNVFRIEGVIGDDRGLLWESTGSSQEAIGLHLGSVITAPYAHRPQRTKRLNFRLRSYVGLGSEFLDVCGSLSMYLGLLIYFVFKGFSWRAISQRKEKNCSASCSDSLSEQLCLIRFT